MKMRINPVVYLGVCIVIAASTVVVSGTLWYLGRAYWLMLGLLAMAQTVASGFVFVAPTGKLWTKLAVVSVFIVGQWWAIQMLAMQIVWRLWSFSP